MTTLWFVVNGLTGRVDDTETFLELHSVLHVCRSQDVTVAVQRGCDNHGVVD